MKLKGVLITGKVAANRQLADEHYLMTVTFSGLFPEPLPGQFVMARLKGRDEPFLSRPFSVYRHEQRLHKSSIEILYRVVGKGTRILSGLKRGALIDIFGPLGNTFDIRPDAKNVILLAGGIGVAPISYLAMFCMENLRYAHVRPVLYAGARSAPQLFGIDDMRESCLSVNISTEDGKEGFHGMVTDLLLRDLPSIHLDQSAIYACGPAPMLKRLHDMLHGQRVFCQVLLEERMACGVGACLGCAVEAKAPDGKLRYLRVCADGPVFNISDVVWK
jgi:dihydroorotate dehydrogenase electron transfer subunit